MLLLSSLILMVYTEASDLLQKLSLETQAKPLEIPEPTKKVIFVFWIICCCCCGKFMIEFFCDIVVAFGILLNSLLRME